MILISSMAEVWFTLGQEGASGVLGRRSVRSFCWALLGVVGLLGVSVEWFRNVLRSLCGWALM